MTDKKAAAPFTADDLSEAERNKLREEGIREAIKEDAKDAYRAGLLSPIANDVQAPQFLGSDDIMQFEGLLDLPADELGARVAEDADNPIPEEKVAGLLKLERNGRNRTEHVKALLARLPVDSVLEVPGAGGPAYTNDTTPVSELVKPKAERAAGRTSTKG